MSRFLLIASFTASLVLVGCTSTNDPPAGDTGDPVITAMQARDVIRSAYPDLDFGEDVMTGTELVNGAWIDGYMMSATVGVDVLEIVVDAHSGEIVKQVTLEGYAAPHL
ncbi:MAG: hypothetical protein ACREBE_11040, partial [bacterium]